MKYKLTAILLIISIVSCSFSRFFIYAGFELNHRYITQTLCVNKDRPWLHCNGKCYLVRKLKQADEKQNAAEREAQKNLAQESYCKSVDQVKFYTRLLQIIPVPNGRFDLPKRHNTIFQPPQLA